MSKTDPPFNLWSGTLATHGSDTLKTELLAAVLADEVAMCLLYSEPSAGSDLASVRTTAVRDGDTWTVSGQKVWTSAAQDADYAMLLARTDWDVPKHQGLTFFWLPMHQPGVVVRPLRQITGDSRFNEVFITEARIPDSHRLGQVGEGWRVLQTALTYERAVMGAMRRSDVPAPAKSAPAERAAAESAPAERAAADDHAAAAESAIESAPADDHAPAAESAIGKTARAFGNIPTPDVSLVSLARSVGVAGDAVLRQRIARMCCLRMVNEWNGRRAAAATGVSGAALASLGKLAMSGILHEAGRLQAHILGVISTLDGDAFPMARDANYSQMNAYFTSIGGGTDQIQRNIIGERILGLPREPEPDRHLPFRSTPS